MDAVIVVAGGAARCVKLRDVKAGDQVVTGLGGVQVFPPFRERDRGDFVFMNNEVSSERRVELAVAQLAEAMRGIRARTGRVIAVPGPVVVHTGGAGHLGRAVPWRPRYPHAGKLAEGDGVRIEPCDRDDR